MDLTKVRGKHRIIRAIGIILCDDERKLGLNECYFAIGHLFCEPSRTGVYRSFLLYMEPERLTTVAKRQ
jgi:hypothetical protein